MNDIIYPKSLNIGRARARRMSTPDLMEFISAWRDALEHADSAWSIARAAGMLEGTERVQS